MDDIVERLRKKVCRGPTMQASHTKTVEWLAADEIERLRGVLEDLQLHSVRETSYWIMIPATEWDQAFSRAALNPK